MDVLYPEPLPIPSFLSLPVSPGPTQRDVWSWVVVLRLSVSRPTVGPVCVVSLLCRAPAAYLCVFVCVSRCGLPLASGPTRAPK